MQHADRVDRAGLEAGIMVTTRAVSARMSSATLEQRLGELVEDGSVFHVQEDGAQACLGAPTSSG